MPRGDGSRRVAHRKIHGRPTLREPGASQEWTAGILPPLRHPQLHGTAAPGTGATPVVPRAFDDAGRGQIFDAGDAFRGIRPVKPRSGHGNLRALPGILPPGRRRCIAICLQRCYRLVFSCLFRIVKLADWPPRLSQTQLCLTSSTSNWRWGRRNFSPDFFPNAASRLPPARCGTGVGGHDGDSQPSGGAAARPVPALRPGGAAGRQSGRA